MRPGKVNVEVSTLTHHLEYLRQGRTPQSVRSKARPAHQFAWAAPCFGERAIENVVAVLPAPPLAAKNTVHIAKEKLWWRAVSVHPAKICEKRGLTGVTLGTRPV